MGAGDDSALDQACVDDVVVDPGSQWGEHEYVTAIGFGT
jgi:hypothetical protein